MRQCLESSEIERTIAELEVALATNNDSNVVAFRRTAS